nr:MAG: ORF1 [Torque teno midi virus]
MPFWWRRRRRYWWGKRNAYFQRRKRRKRWPRRTRRRRTWKTARRRRRRRRTKHKVRRKRKAIPIVQWQPDSITKCKIKGIGCLILGAEGHQMYCYTDNYNKWTPPRTPGGGSFAVEQFSLSSLYEQYKFRRNIWTKTNILKDLCRYLYCKFTFYRHSYIDFIITYERQPPFKMNKWTYPNTHPVNLLLQQHKVIIPSQMTNPRGKLTKKIIVKPPKQMLSKWFFMDQFSNYPLVLLRASAANFSAARIAPTAQNTLLEFYYLNTTFYTANGWGRARGQTTTDPQYKPYSTAPNEYWVTYITDPNKKVQVTITPQHTVSYTGGYFQSKLLRAQHVYQKQGDTTPTAATPINVARYNPERDTGKGNSVFFISSLIDTYKKPTDEVLYIDGLPIWMSLFGLFDYVEKMKKGKAYLDSYFCAIQSPAIEPAPQIGASQFYIPIDKEFIEGRGPFGSYLTESTRSKWFPTVYSQVKILNIFVESGPLIPKLSEERNSSWELDYKYMFLFKWGGPQITDPAIADPTTQGHYDVPDTITSAIQIRDPAKQKAASILHSWDYRRGIITEKALKRMSEHLEIDSTFEPDTGPPPIKKKKATRALPNPQESEEEIQTCLLSLFEEDTFQETQDQATLQQLIQQQHIKQQQLKRNLLQLISDLKAKQTMLQLQAGII